MKKTLLLIALFLFGIANLAALEPIRVSIATDIFCERDVYIDILDEDGAATAIPRITKTGCTDDAGILTFVIDEDTWTDLDYRTNYAVMRDYLIRITYNRDVGDDVIIGLERFQDVLGNQGLFGAVVDPTELDQTGDYTFGSLTVGPDGDGNTTRLPFGKDPLELFSMVLKDDGTTDGIPNNNYINKITFDAPYDVIEDYTLVFPDNRPAQDQSVLVWLNDQTNNGGHLVWSTYVADVIPDAGLDYSILSGARFFSSNDVSLMADIDEITLKFDSYFMPESSQVYVPSANAKIIVNENNPFNWNALHVFSAGLRDTTLAGGPHWSIDPSGNANFLGDVYFGNKLFNEQIVIAKGTGTSPEVPYVNFINTTTGSAVLEIGRGGGMGGSGYGVKINDDAGITRSGIGYEPSLSAWVAGTQKPIYTQNTLTDLLLAGSQTTDNTAKVSVQLIHFPPAGNPVSNEVAMNLRYSPFTGNAGAMVNPVFYVNKAGLMNFGIDIDGNVQMKGSIFNDGVVAPNAITIDDQLVVLGDISKDGIAAGSSKLGWVTVNDELYVNSKLSVNGLVTFAASGNSYTFPAERGTDGQILQSDGFGVLSWANLPTITLQTAYDNGQTINANVNGPVRILNATQPNGGLDVYASGAALDAIDAQLDGTLDVTQAAVQGIYRRSGITNYGYLGGNLALTSGPLSLNYSAGAIGSTGSDPLVNPFGALGITFTVNGIVMSNYAGFFSGDVMIKGALSIVGDTGPSYTFPEIDGTSGQVLTTNGAGIVSWESIPSNYWGLSGNDVADDGSNFIGTTDDQPLVFKVKGDKAGEVSTGTNTSFGYLALNPVSTGTYNTVFGYEALKANTGGSANTAIGGRALYTNTDGTYNTAIGYWAMVDNTIGQFNTAVGYMALNTNKANSRSTAIGLRAMYWADDQTTGVQTHNTAVGYEALFGSSTPANNTGTHNTAVGDEAMWSNTRGNRNTAVGDRALNSNTSGSNSTAVGYEALKSSLGYENTAIGAGAGNFYSNGTTPATACSSSVYVGAYTKAKYQDLYTEPYRNNEIVIGYTAIGNGTNTVTLGNSSVIGLYSMGATTSTTEAPNMYVNPTTGQIMRSTAPVGSGVTLQVSYDNGQTINANVNGPVRILNATQANGGLDVYASGAALDAIDAQLTGTTLTQQAAVQGIYTLGSDSHYGYLGGNLGDDTRAGVVGSVGVGGPYGALGATIYETTAFVNYAGYFAGDVKITGDIFAEANRFEVNTVSPTDGLPIVKIYKPGVTKPVFELGYGSSLPYGDWDAGYGMVIRDDAGKFRTGAGMSFGQWVSGVQGGTTASPYWAGARTTGGSDASLGIVVGTTVMFGADQTGDAFVGRNLTVTNELRFMEPSGSGTEYAAFIAPDLDDNNTYTLPNAIGTEGQVLTISSSPAPTATTATLEWTTPSTGGGNLSVTIISINDPYSILSTDNIVVYTGTGDVIFTLPDPTENSGKVFYIYNKTGFSNMMTIESAVVPTWYDFMAVPQISSPIVSGTFMSDGNNWIMINGFAGF